METIRDNQVRRRRRLEYRPGKETTHESIDIARTAVCCCFGRDLFLSLFRKKGRCSFAGAAGAAAAACVLTVFAVTGGGGGPVYTGKGTGVTLTLGVGLKRHHRHRHRQSTVPCLPLGSLGFSTFLPPAGPSNRFSRRLLVVEGGGPERRDGLREDDAGPPVRAGRPHRPRRGREVQHRLHAAEEDQRRWGSRQGCVGEVGKT